MDATRLSNTSADQNQRSGAYPGFWTGPRKEPLLGDGVSIETFLSHFARTPDKTKR